MSHYVSVIKYLVISLAQMLIGLISIPILTNLMSPTELGKFGIILSVSAILAPLLILNADHYYPVIKTGHAKKLFPSVKKSIFLFGFSIGVFFTIIAALFLPLYYHSFGLLFLLTPAFVLLRGFRSSSQAELVVDERIYTYGLSNIFVSLLSLLFSFVFLYFISDDAFSRLIALLIAEFVVLFFLFRHTESMKNGTWNKKELYKAVRFSAPLLVSLLPAWIINEYGKLHVASIGTMHEVGVLTVAMQFSAFQLQLNSAMSNAFLKRIHIDKDSLFSYPMLGNYVVFLILAMSFGASFIYFFASDMISVEYSGFIEISLICFVGVFFQSVTVLLCFYSNKTGNTSWRLYSLTIAALVFLFNIYFSSSDFSLIELVAISYSMAMFCYFVTLLIYVVRHYAKSRFS
ncbi:hypothetical protein KJI95_00480 [Shewanella sp. JM162201]|uniref:Polysaccharide biosynthesis protein n=1 Tax=Shewanella jiangmenensis TaxID=2837387 RepID=A0ABS5UZE0_9GAMM|nr:hypothetical protein [Shewanella jiangmenensis]MBT1443003.1 hypothetical protein [Shewanella jiangmenensis]